MTQEKLTDEQLTFIDEYLQTFAIEQSAIKAGFPKNEAMTIGIELLANPLIQEEMKSREEIFNRVADNNKLTPQRLMNSMMYQYNKANKFGKTKEAVDILERIAKWSGLNPDTLQADPIVINLNGLDEDKI